MLYEVTGMRLHNNEFQHESLSDSEDDEELLPIDYALMDRLIDEEEDDTGKKAELSFELNP